jgi:hypothetical protein
VRRIAAGNPPTPDHGTSNLLHFVLQLERLTSNPDLEVFSEVLGGLFGEEPSVTVIREFADRTGSAIDRGSFRSRAGTGRAALVSSGIITGLGPMSPDPTQRPRHTFYGAT